MITVYIDGNGNKKLCVDHNGYPGRFYDVTEDTITDFAIELNRLAVDGLVKFRPFLAGLGWVAEVAK